MRILSPIAKSALKVTLLTVPIVALNRKIEHLHPILRSIVLILINGITFVFFYALVFIYLYSKLPPSSHELYKLLFYGVLFISAVGALVISYILHMVIRAVAIAGSKIINTWKAVVALPTKGLNYVRDSSTKAVDVAQSKVSTAKSFLSKGSKAAQDIGKKGVDVTKKGLDASVNWTKDTAPKVGDAVQKSVKSGAGFVKEKGSNAGGTIADASKASVEWAKSNIPRGQERAGSKVQVIWGKFIKVSGIIKHKIRKKKTEDGTNEMLKKEP